MLLACHFSRTCVTVENISSKWVPEVRIHCGDVPIVLVGTQIDLRDDSSTVEEVMKKNQRGPITHEEGVAKAEEIHAFSYVECSTSTSVGVDDAFREAARAVLSTEKTTNNHPCFIM